MFIKGSPNDLYTNFLSRIMFLKTVGNFFRISSNILNKRTIACNEGDVYIEQGTFKN
jgi:hypothetical protein